LSEKLDDVQSQLLAVVSSAESGRGLGLLRKQQMTRTSAELALAGLREARLEALTNWLRLRSGTAEFDFAARQAMEQRDALVSETTRQVEVWTAASQTTILSPAPGTDPTSVKNVELAHAAAQETIALIDAIHDALDDLGLLREALTAAQVGMERGLRSIQAWLSIVVGDARHLLAGYLDFTLFHVGETPVTLGSILKMLVILVLGLALSWFIRHLLERLKDRRQFAGSPAVYTLGRLLHYLIILVAIFAAFSSIGLDFRNFALIAGALSVGIGFGLQSIVNNFVSGLILLFEGSLRVGDYIELETGLQGIVKEINTRSTLIRTNDNIDMVVPNSHFMTSQLTNWTLREPMARFRIGFGVAYGSDKQKVREAALAAAAKVDLVVKHMPSRQPDVWLVDFGDNALLFELLVWVSQAGVRRPARVRAEILWELETQLRERGIEIPFPQRDLHLRSGFLRDNPEQAGSDKPA
jgi:small-conductance mechanosensitive channel